MKFDATESRAAASTRKFGWLAAGWVAAALSFSGAARAQQQSPYYGDVDGNGVLDARDAMYAYFYVLGYANLPSDWISRLDVDHNGTIDIRDAGLIRWAATEILPTPPFNSPDPNMIVVTSIDPRYGPTGTRVTILGDHFRPGSTYVRLNGIDLPILDAQTNRILAQIPLGAGSGYLTVQVGTNAPTLGVPFVVGALPMPQTPTPTLQFGQAGFGEAVWLPQSSGATRLTLSVPINTRCDPSNLGAVQFLVYFDPTILQCTSVGAGLNSPLGQTNTLACIDNVHGGVSLCRVLDHPPQPPSGNDAVVQVAVLYFQVLRRDVSMASLGGLSLVVTDPSVPSNSVGSRPHPEFMLSRRIRF